MTFLSGPLSRGWSASLLGGGHWQETTDVNGDAWADLAGYARAVVRPRVFWDGGNGRTFFATTGFTYEDREGGTLDGQVLAATGQPYVEALETHRYDAGALAQFLFKGRYVMTARAAVARQSHDHQFGDVDGTRSARHGFWRSGGAWNRGPPDVGRRARHRTRRVHGARCASIRLHLHRAWRVRAVRRHRVTDICRCLPVLDWTSTASTARSSVLACRRWRTRGAGRAGCRSEPASSDPRRSPKRPRPPASRVSRFGSPSRPSAG